MDCSVCEKEIPSIFECDFPEEAEYLLMENGDIVCTDTECRMEHMKAHRTAAQLDEYFSFDETAAGYRDIFKTAGFDAIPPQEMELMLEWYESGNTFEMVNETWYSMAFQV